MKTLTLTVTGTFNFTEPMVNPSTVPGGTWRTRCMPTPGASGQWTRYFVLCTPAGRVFFGSQGYSDEDCTTINSLASGLPYQEFTCVPFHLHFSGFLGVDNYYVDE